MDFFGDSFFCANLLINILTKKTKLIVNLAIKKIMQKTVENFTINYILNFYLLRSKS